METTQNRPSSKIEEVASKAHNATDNLARGAHRMTDQAAGVVGTIADAAGHAKESVEHMASSAAETVTHAKDAVVDWTSETAHQTGAYIKSGADEATHLIRRYPITAVLVGVGIGFMLAKVARA
jgi:ElaB/YqjD/DUF883 family membrane-anchored ribosome-binding protein